MGNQKGKLLRVSLGDDSSALHLIDLPIELWELILMNADAKALATIVPRVCKLLNELSSQDHIWKHKYYLEYNPPVAPQLENDMTWKKMYFNGRSILFPLYGIEIGKTTKEQLRARSDAKNNGDYFTVQDVNFWVHSHPDHNVFNGMYIARGIYIIPPSWEQKGITWKKSYEKYKVLLKQLLGNVSEGHPPRFREWQGEQCFQGELVSFGTEGNVQYEIKFGFDYRPGDVADDHYHRFEEDIALMQKMGINSFRLSISWSRILPTGEGEVNQKGIEHYNKVIDALIAANIEPLVTLYHWDLPQALNDKYGGWLNNSLAPIFANYADICFKAFGDRVKWWLTFNEPLTFVVLGYGSGVHAPGRCSDRSICAEGNSTTEPWIAGHTVLVAHGMAVNIYRTKYQQQQQGLISIALSSDWSEPLTSSQADLDASQRSMDFEIGWFADPIWFGDYPASMRKRVGSLLPRLTATEKQLLKGSSDYYAMNHYTSSYVFNDPNPGPGNYAGIEGTDEKDGVPIGPTADSDWLRVVPWGMRRALNYINKHYNSPWIIITENGCDVPGEGLMPVEQALNDTFRVDYYSAYLDNMSKAMHEDSISVLGYFAWSLMDNFEWADGYLYRFGVHYVDYKNGLTRYQKRSAQWLTNYIAENTAH